MNAPDSPESDRHNQAQRMDSMLIAGTCEALPSYAALRRSSSKDSPLLSINLDLAHAGRLPEHCRWPMRSRRRSRPFGPAAIRLSLRTLPVLVRVKA